jgi:2-amino-4-hydroxy-6-hydroxymethyldihydropteridine diphosphokinase
MHEREFVLKGLCEIAPEFVHPRLNKTAKKLYEELMSPHESDKINSLNAETQQPPEK